MSDAEFEAQIPEEIQTAILGDFLQTAAGQGVQTLIQLTVPAVRDEVRLNAALALVGLYDQFAMGVYEDTSNYDGTFDGPDFNPDRQSVDTDRIDAGTWDDPGGPPGGPPEGTLTTEEALARLQVLQGGPTVEDQEEQEGAGSLGGASGIGPRNPRGSRKRRKHGRR